MGNSGNDAIQQLPLSLARRALRYTEEWIPLLTYRYSLNLPEYSSSARMIRTLTYLES